MVPMTSLSFQESWPIGYGVQLRDVHQVSELCLASGTLQTQITSMSVIIIG